MVISINLTDSLLQQL